MAVGKKSISTRLWFSAVSIILILAGIVFAFLGLRILPARGNVLLQWESAIYGAIMMGWGTTLFFAGRLAFRRDDPDLMKSLLYGLTYGLLSKPCSRHISGSGSTSAWMRRSLRFSASL